MCVAIQAVVAGNSQLCRFLRAERVSAGRVAVHGQGCPALEDIIAVSDFVLVGFLVGILVQKLHLMTKLLADQLLGRAQLDYAGGLTCAGSLVHAGIVKKYIYIFLLE